MSFARLRGRGLAVSATCLLIAGPALAQKKYDPGASDTEIKVGNMIPYSGPASAYGIIGKTHDAYFRMINDQGGVNGRKIKYISYDDAYSPPKAVEQARKLVESDEVLLIFNPLGTANNTAIRRYMNQKKVPQLFTATGATTFADPKGFPYTFGWQPNYQSEGRIYATYILSQHPNGKIAVLYQNDDYGKDYLKGLTDGLGAKAATMLVSQATYEVADPTVDSQLVKFKASGADIFINITTPKFAAQSIRKLAEIGWKPTHFLNNVSASVGSVLKPAGLENAKDIISANYYMDPLDAKWKDHPAIKEWSAFMEKYYPDGDRTSGLTVYGYLTSQTLVHVLKQAGDNLTRDNIAKQAASMKDVTLPALLPGITLNTSADDFAPIEQMQLMKFNGESWELFGEVLSGGARKS